MIANNNTPKWYPPKDPAISRGINDALKLMQDNIYALRDGQSELSANISTINTNVSNLSGIVKTLSPSNATPSSSNGGSVGPVVKNPPTLEVNGNLASSQTLQNLIQGNNITITDGGNGNITFAANAGGLANPMTTLGDMITGNNNGVPQRLGVGSNNQVLTVVTGVPVWANANGGFTNPMTTLGDIITGNNNGVAQRLGVGSNNQVLTVVAGVPAWANDTDFTNPMTTLGDIIVGAANGVPARLGVGANGKVLTSNNVATDGIEWDAPISLTTTGSNGAATLTPGVPYTLNVPNYVGGGGGSAAFVFLEGHTASNSTELDFTAWYSSSYDDYQIEFINLIPVNNGSRITIQCSINGGVSYDTGNNYAYGVSWISTIGTTGTDASNTVNGVYVSGGTGGVTVSNVVSRGGLSSTVKLYGPASVVSNKQFTGITVAPFSGAGGTHFVNLSGFYANANNNINAFKVFSPDGNLSTGTVRIYGISH